MSHSAARQTERKEERKVGRARRGAAGKMGRDSTRGGNRAAAWPGRGAAPPTPGPRAHRGAGVWPAVLANYCLARPSTAVGGPEGPEGQEGERKTTGSMTLAIRPRGGRRGAGRGTSGERRGAEEQGEVQGRGSRRPAPHTDRMRTSSRRVQRAQRACMSVHLSAFCKRSNLSRIPAASRAGPRGGGRTGSASTPASGTYPPDEPVVNGRPLTSGRSGRERDFHLFESACERGGGAARSKNAGRSISGQGPPLRREPADSKTRPAA